MEKNGEGTGNMYAENKKHKLLQEETWDHFKNKGNVQIVNRGFIENRPVSLNAFHSRDGDGGWKK